MFLANLNDEQKKAFLSIAMKIIGVDKHLDARERQMIQAMRSEMGLFQEITLPHGSLEELAKPFNTRRAQSIVLMEGIALALADSEFSGDEQKILRALAIIFDIPEEKASEMENWVIEYKKLIDKANQILGPAPL